MVAVVRVYECLCVIIFGKLWEKSVSAKNTRTERQRDVYTSTVLAFQRKIYITQVEKYGKFKSYHCRALDVSIKWSLKMVLHVILCKNITQKYYYQSFLIFTISWFCEVKTWTEMRFVRFRNLILFQTHGRFKVQMGYTSEWLKWKGRGKRLVTSCQPLCVCVCVKRLQRNEIQKW